MINLKVLRKFIHFSVDFDSTRVNRLKINSSHVASVIIATKQHNNYTHFIFSECLFCECKNVSLCQVTTTSFNKNVNPEEKRRKSNEIFQLFGSFFVSQILSQQMSKTLYLRISFFFLFFFLDVSFPVETLRAPKINLIFFVIIPFELLKWKVWCHFSFDWKFIHLLFLPTWNAKFMQFFFCSNWKCISIDMLVIICFSHARSAYERRI